MFVNATTPIEKVLADASTAEGVFLGNVSIEHGLLPREAPPESLPSSLRYIDDCLNELPTFYREGTVCRNIAALPRPHHQDMASLSAAHKIRLSMAFGFLVYSYRYAWQDGLEVVSHRGPPSAEEREAISSRKSLAHIVPSLAFMQGIDRNIVAPWRLLCSMMGRDRSYFEAELFTLNFAMRGRPYTGPGAVSQDDCDPMFRFFGTDTERFFFLGVQEVTARFNCVPALVGMQRAMQARDHAAVVHHADELVALWRTITEDVFMRFDTRIDPVEWSATVGKWTASPLPEQEGFSGMFFPAFHLLDVLLERTRYSSVLGELILKVQHVLPLSWRKLFDAVRAMPLRRYVEQFSGEHPELVRALYRIQDVYQHFFVVHRRKVFSFEYQGIVSGRNSTNGGISASIKEMVEQSVYDLATWNKIDTILSDSARERPFEDMSSASRCPFTGRSLAGRAEGESPPVVAACPFGGKGGEPLPPPGDVHMPRWRPRMPAGPGDDWHGILLEELPVRPRPGDRCLLLLDEAGTEHLECDFVGSLDAPPYAVMTPRPVEALHAIKILPGVFARRPGDGPRARQTAGLPAFVLAQGPRCAVATTLASASSGPVFVAIEGHERDHAFCVANGLPADRVAVLGDIDEIAIHLPEVGLPAPRGAVTSITTSWLRQHRDELVFYVCGDPGFVRRGNHVLRRLFGRGRATYHEWLAELRESKRYRPIVYEPTRAAAQRGRLYPWDVLSSRDKEVRVVLHDRVLNITDFMFMHYGGDNIFRLLAGTDVSNEFGRAHPGNQVNMPDVVVEAGYVVPEGLADLLKLAYQVARSANVLRQAVRKLSEYEDAPYVQAQRTMTVVLAASAEMLWGPSMASAFRTERRSPTLDTLRSIHFRWLAALGGALELPDRVDTYLPRRVALAYGAAFEAALDGILQAMRMATNEGDRAASADVLKRQYERYLTLVRSAFQG